VPILEASSAGTLCGSGACSSPTGSSCRSGTRRARTGSPSATPSAKIRARRRAAALRAAMRSRRARRRSRRGPGDRTTSAAPSDRSARLSYLAAEGRRRDAPADPRRGVSARSWITSSRLCPAPPVLAWTCRAAATRADPGAVRRGLRGIAHRLLAALGTGPSGWRAFARGAVHRRWRRDIRSGQGARAHLELRQASPERAAQRVAWCCCRVLRKFLSSHGERSVRARARGKPSAGHGGAPELPEENARARRGGGPGMDLRSRRAGSSSRR